MSLNMPLSLIRHHGSMLKTLGGIFLSSLQPRPKNNPEQIEDVKIVLPAPDKELVGLYQRWCTYAVETENGNAPLDTDSDLPPHLFSQFALAICAKQLKQLRYKLLSVINQGVGLEVHHPIPKDEALHIICKVVEIKEENNRARIHQQLQIGTQSQPHCYTASFHTLFILGKSLKKDSSKKQSKDEEHVEFEKVGHWTVAPNDGLNFALLTGDFNPIHWVGLVAKFSPFGQKVLHGFGMFTRTIETIQASAGKPIKSIHVRFINPAFLNNQQVSVLLSPAHEKALADEKALVDEKGLQKLELRDSLDKPLMVGEVKI